MSTDERRTHEEQVAFVNESLEKAGALRKKKQYKEAIALLVEALQYGLEKAQIYYRLGNTYIDGDDLARAEYAYNRALEMDPNFVNAMHNLAVVYRRQKKMALYVKTYKKSQRLAIKNPHKTDFNADQKKKIRGLSRTVFLWLFGGAALIVLLIWLLAR
ncbi:tetratricopeptide repeat protein [Candidatus Bipolaricaulota bacterium]|nr:tetratricopeptide repeat protein [Candidatus Bipolaricaulota bacterium]